MNRYSAYGLEIDSELPIPWLLPGSDRSSDVTIRLDEVPLHLPDPVGKGWYFEATPDSFLFRVRDTARFLIIGERKILVDRLPGSREDALLTFLMGSAFGALLHQRRLLVMHASSIQTAHGAALFVGPSGHGKSTLLAALVNRGYAMLADDVTAIDVDAVSGPVALPGFPRMRLGAESVERLGWPADSLHRDWYSGKYEVPVDNFCTEALPVRAVYDLGVHQAPDILVEPAGGIERFAVVSHNTYRYGFLEALGLRQMHFEAAAQLAKTVQARRVSRPESPMLLEELVDRLQEDLGEPVDTMQEQEAGT